MCTSCYSMHSQWPYNWANGTEWTSASIFMASWEVEAGEQVLFELRAYRGHLVIAGEGGWLPWYPHTLGVSYVPQLTNQIAPRQ